MGPRSFLRFPRWTRVIPFLPFLFVLALGACSEQDVLLPRADTPAGIVVVDAAMCGPVFSTPLIAGQKFNAGSVTVSNDENTLYVTLITTGGWTLDQSHVAVAASKAGIPVNKAGNPEPGQFAWKADHDAGTTSHTYSVPREGFAEGAPFYVAAQADVKNGSQAQGAWGQGTPFVPKGNWAMFFTVSLNPCQGVVKGRVVDAETQAVLGGATVTLTDNGQQTTGEDGTFVFDPVHIGSYAAHVTRTAFHPADVATVAVTKNTTTDLGDIPLQPMKGLISGRVIDEGNGLPVAASINVSRDGVVLQSLTAAADGSFTTDLLRIGAYDLMLTDPLHHPKLVAAVVVTVDATTQAGDLAMRPLTGAVSGTVADMFTHGPLAGVAVVMTAGANSYNAVTDADGKYAFTDVRIGSYTVTFSIADFDPRTIQPVQVDAGGSVAMGTTELRPFTGYFGVRVGDALNTSPIPNATVVVSAHGATVATLTTDATGHAEVELRIGNYTAVASAPAFHTSQVVPFMVTHAGTTSKDINLQPQMGRLYGKVTDALNGAPVHAYLELRSLVTGQVEYTGVTAGAQQTFDFLQVRIGRYTLEVSAPQFDSNAVGPLDITTGGSVQADATLQPWQGFIAALVEDAELHTPIPGATVTIATPAGATLATRQTGADGRIEPFQTRLGQYRVTATAADFHNSPVMTPIVGHDATANVTLPLAAHRGVIVGRLLDEFNNTPIANASIKVRRVADNAVVAQGSSQTSGTINIGNLRVGSYTVEFTKPDFDDRSITPVTVVLAPPPTSLGDVTLRPWTGYLRVRVTDVASGAAIVGATVRILAGATQVASKVTEAPYGDTQAEELRIGTYDVEVSAPGYVTSTRSAATVTHAGTVLKEVALQLAVGGISGVLRDSDTNALIPGGTVQVIDGTTVVQAMTTAADGAFNFANVPVGAYKVHFEAPNYIPRDYTPIAVTTGTINDLGTVPLYPQRGYLAFQVRQAVTTTPIVGATIEVYSGSTLVATGTSQAPYGGYEAHLRVGSYTARVSAPGYITQDVPAMVVTYAGTTSREVLLVPATGTVQGLVRNASNDTPLAGATVQVLTGTTVVASTTTTGTGTFGPLTLDPGSYTVRASASGFVPASATVTVTAGGTHNIGTLALSVANGAAQGTVTNATNGYGLVGAIVEFLSGTNVITSVSTGSGGSFGPVSLAPGSYTARASLTGYTTATTPVTVNAGATTYTGVIALSPVMPEGQVRVTLTWGASPRDLDSHLTGPNSSGGRFHVYYAHLSDSGATLDHDDVTSYGPETITFTQLYSGAYRYSVYNWSQDAELRLSGAVVTVYRGNTQIAQYTVPNQGGITWTVFELNGATLTPINTISSGQPSLLAAGAAPRLQDDVSLIGNAIRRNPKR